MKHRLPDLQFPDHPSRICSYQCTRMVLQVQEFQNFLYALLALTERNIIEPGHEHQVFICRQHSVDGNHLRHVSDKPPDFGRMTNYIVSFNLCFSARWRKQSDQYPDGCCLAGAVWPEEREDFTPLDAERDGVDGSKVVESFGKVCNGQDRRHYFTIPSSRRSLIRS